MSKQILLVGYVFLFLIVFEQAAHACNDTMIDDNSFNKQFPNITLEEKNTGKFADKYFDQIMELDTKKLQKLTPKCTNLQETRALVIIRILKLSKEVQETRFNSTYTNVSYKSKNQWRNLKMIRLLPDNDKNSDFSILIK